MAERLEEAVDLLRQVARIDLDAGRYESAVDRLNTDLAICREVNVPRVEAQARHRLGEVLFRQRRYDQAKLVMGDVRAARTGPHLLRDG